MPLNHTALSLITPAKKFTSYRKELSVFPLSLLCREHSQSKPSISMDLTTFITFPKNLHIQHEFNAHSRADLHGISETPQPLSLWLSSVTFLPQCIVYLQYVRFWIYRLLDLCATEMQHLYATPDILSQQLKLCMSIEKHNG